MRTDTPELGNVTPMPSTRSRVSNGSELLPGVDNRSRWARLFKDVRGMLIQHLGGEDRMSAPQHSLCRRVATFEAELVHMEADFAASRESGETPAQSELDLYSRMTSAQRRILDTLGLDRKAFDVTPPLTAYLAKHPRQ